MTRKEPRTESGKRLLGTAYLAGDAASEGVNLLDSILAIEAEASRPPVSGDAVERLRRVMYPMMVDPLTGEEHDRDALIAAALAATPPERSGLGWPLIFRAFGAAFGVGIDPTLREKVQTEYDRLSSGGEDTPA